MRFYYNRNLFNYGKTRIAQQVEHSTINRSVIGSSPITKTVGLREGYLVAPFFFCRLIFVLTA